MEFDNSDPFVVVVEQRPKLTLLRYLFYDRSKQFMGVFALLQFLLIGPRVAGPLFAVAALLGWGGRSLQLRKPRKLLPRGPAVSCRLRAEEQDRLPFNRRRMSATLRECLFAVDGHDIAIAAVGGTFGRLDENWLVTVHVNKRGRAHWIEIEHDGEIVGSWSALGRIPT